MRQEKKAIQIAKVFPNQAFLPHLPIKILKKRKKENQL